MLKPHSARARQPGQFVFDGLPATGHSGQFSGVAGIFLGWTRESPGKGRPRIGPDPVKGQPHDEAP